MMLRNLGCLLVIAMAVAPVWAIGSAAGIGSSSLETREARIWASRSRSQRLSALTSAAPRVNCERTNAPEALASPGPWIDSPASKLKIIVTFIIGVDGQVHSPLILQSAGDYNDKVVLNTVRAWRFRPAMCNGSPAESDGKIEFSRR